MELVTIGLPKDRHSKVKIATTLQGGESIQSSITEAVDAWLDVRPAAIKEQVEKLFKSHARRSTNKVTKSQ